MVQNRIGFATPNENPGQQFVATNPPAVKTTVTLNDAASLTSTSGRGFMQRVYERIYSAEKVKNIFTRL